MIRSSARPVLAAFVAGFCLLTAAETSVAQAPAPSWKYITWTEMEVNDLPAVTSLMEKWTTFVKENVPGYHPYEYMTGSDGKAYLVEFFNEFNDIPKSEATFFQALEKYNAKGLPDLSAQWLGAMNRVDSSIWELKVDLSYMPAETMASFQEAFRKLIVFHVKQDKVAEWQEATKALNQTDRSAGITKPRFVFEAKVGKDLPAFSYVVPAGDIFDYYAGLSDRETKRRAARGTDGTGALRNSARTAEELHLTMHPECSKLPTP